MDKNSEKKCQVPHKYYIVNCGSFTGCRFICNDQYASEIYYSGDHYSIVSGCNLFFGRFHFNLSDGRKESQRRTV